jgi:hypothetical protein
MLGGAPPGKDIPVKIATGGYFQGRRGFIASIALKQAQVMKPQKTAAMYVESLRTIFPRRADFCCSCATNEMYHPLGDTPTHVLTKRDRLLNGIP